MLYEEPLCSLELGTVGHKKFEISIKNPLSSKLQKIQFVHFCEMAEITVFNITYLKLL